MTNKDKASQQTAASRTRQPSGSHPPSPLEEGVEVCWCLSLALCPADVGAPGQAEYISLVLILLGYLHVADRHQAPAAIPFDDLWGFKRQGQGGKGEQQGVRGRGRGRGRDGSRDLNSHGVQHQPPTHRCLARPDLHQAPPPSTVQRTQVTHLYPAANLVLYLHRLPCADRHFILLFGGKVVQHCATPQQHVAVVVAVQALQDKHTYTHTTDSRVGGAACSDLWGECGSGLTCLATSPDTPPPHKTSRHTHCKEEHTRGA